MIEIIALANLIILLMVLANAAKWPALRRAGTPTRAAVSVLIPARNEELHIADAVRSALDQGLPVREVLVYDDHSEDATGRIVERLRRESDRVRIVEPEPLPEGWLGKPFACDRLAAVASGEWLLFLDADTRLQAGAVAAMLDAVTQYRVTFLSCWPAILAESLQEKIFMPMLNFVVFSLFPTPMQLKDRSPALGLAHGACLFLHRETYHAVGGHSCVRQELFEDTMLARAWRQAREQSLCLNGRRFVAVRMYTNLQEIIAGFSKIAYPAFRRERSFWLFIGFHFGCMLLPFLLLPFAARLHLPPVALGVAAGAVLAARGVQCLQFGYPLWSALFHPVAEIGLLGLGLQARHQCRHCNGVQWKGRTFNPAGAP